MLIKRQSVSVALVWIIVLHASQTASAWYYASQSENSIVAAHPHSGVQRRTITPLQRNESVHSEIARDELQNFTIELDSSQYAAVVFEWQGINLSVALFDPTGKKLIPSEVQVSSPGPVSVSILAERSGTYKLEVRTPAKQKISGKYEVKLEEPRLPNAADRNRLAAQDQICEGQNASSASAKIQNYKQALALLQEAGDMHSEAIVLMLLGDAYKAAQDLQDAKASAIASYKQAAAKWNENKYPRGEAYAKISLGLFYRSFASAKDDALALFEEARLLFAQIGDRRGEADARWGHAFTLGLIGQTPQAIVELQQTVQIRRADGDRLGEGSALNMMADAYRLLGDLDKSLELYAQALSAISGLEHRNLEASLTNGRAVVYDDQGHWQKAKEEYARALNFYESLLGQPVLNACSPNPSSQDTSSCRAAAFVLINLGETYNSLGQPERAKEEFNKSLTITNALGEPLGKGLARFHLGYAYFLLGDTAAALTYYEQALEFQQKAGDEKGKAQTYTYMGMAHVARNEPNLALELYQKALPIQLASGDKRALAITLDKLATSNSLLGNVTESSLNYAKALELWRAIKDPDGEALTLHNIAVAEAATRNLDAANQNAEASIKLVESLRTRLSSGGLRASYLANKENYFELDIDIKMQLAKSENREDYVGAALESKEKSRARVLLEALSQAGVGRAEFNQSSDPRLAGLIERRLRLAANLGAKANARTRLLSKDHTGEQIAAVDRDISDIGDQYDELEAKVRTQSPRFAALTEPQLATAKNIQQQLDNDTLLLEYSLGEARSYVWVVTPDLVKGVALAGRKEIEDAAERMNKALTQRSRVSDSSQPTERQRDKADAEYSKAAAELSKLIIQPVAALLGNKRLVIVADGTLQLVSFGALPDPNGINPSGDRTATTRTAKKAATESDPKTLLENHEIVYEASASVLVLQRKEFGSRQPARHALAVLADPVFDQEGLKLELEKRRAAKAREAPPQPGRDSSGSSNEARARSRSDLTRAIDDMGIGSISALPESRDEAEAIMKVVPKGEGMSALGFDASRATVMSPDLSQYRIIHFATHGFADLNHPELSGIVLSLIDAKGQPQDGFLRLHDIYNLNLPADLVVLSACQTGVGKQIRGEGLIALTRGFTYAGAASVVASLWKVDDEATKILMEEFYKQMFTNKLKPAAALQKAQLKLAHQSEWRSPFYWAGFVLQGEWK